MGLTRIQRRKRLQSDDVSPQERAWLAFAVLADLDEPPLEDHELFKLLLRLNAFEVRERLKELDERLEELEVEQEQLHDADEDEDVEGASRVAQAQLADQFDSLRKARTTLLLQLILWAAFAEPWRLPLCEEIL
jgi:hypothetical protein